MFFHASVSSLILHIGPSSVGLPSTNITDIADLSFHGFVVASDKLVASFIIIILFIGIVSKTVEINVSLDPMTPVTENYLLKFATRCEKLAHLKRQLV
jgi:hypothetical protein